MKSEATFRRPGRVAFIVAVAVLALLLFGAVTAGAAKPPEGKTYFTAFVGIEDSYDVGAQCFEFTDTEFCSIDGELCGSWRRTEGRGLETEFSFSLSFLDEGELVSLDGQARVDARGGKSSIGGVGRLDNGGSRSNFSFGGRAVAPGRCLELLEDAPGAGDREIIEGSGNLVTESRAVDDFTGVAIAGAGRVTLEHGSSESLTITADDNILPILTSEVTGGVLFLGTEDDFGFSTDTPPLYEITIGELESLLVAGAVGVEATGVDTELLDVNIAGASGVTVAGQVDRQVLALAGACRYEAEALDSRVTTVNIAGASTAVVRVRELLEGQVSGASVLEYYGNPVLNVNAGGVAVVRRAGD